MNTQEMHMAVGTHFSRPRLLYRTSNWYHLEVHLVPHLCSDEAIWRRDKSAGDTHCASNLPLSIFLPSVWSPLLSGA